MLRLMYTFVLMIAAFLPTIVAGQEWPRFRGPAGDGHASVAGLPLEWSETQNVAWKRPIPGLGWSSPIVFEGRVYVTTAVTVAAEQAKPESSEPKAGEQADKQEAPGPKAEDRSLRALCLDTASGDVVWDVEVFTQDGSTAPGIHSKNSHASPTPLIHDRRLYVHFGHQGTACLDLDGNVLWRNTSVQYRPVHGNGGTPIVFDDALIFSVDGAQQQFVIALDCKTGEMRWKTDRQVDFVKRFSFSTPQLITVNDQPQVISPGSGSVSGFDPRTGREIWRVRYEGYSVIPCPVFGHGLVFVCTGYDSPSVLAIRPDGEGDVTDTHVQWRVTRGAPHTPSLLLVGDELYMISDRGIAACLDAKTGDVHWQERIGGNYSASPLYADGRIYVQSEQGTGLVLKAGTEYERLAENSVGQPGERTFASYAVGEGSLFIRSETHLYRIHSR